MRIVEFYANDYGDDTWYVGALEVGGRKTVVHRGLCRANALTCVTFGEKYLAGEYQAGMNDYFDSIIEQIAIIDRDRSE